VIGFARALRSLVSPKALFPAPVFSAWRADPFAMQAQAPTVGARRPGALPRKMSGGSSGLCDWPDARLRDWPTDRRRPRAGFSPRAHSSKARPLVCFFTACQWRARFGRDSRTGFWRAGVHTQRALALTLIPACRAPPYRVV
jgi:hypothetical protein